MNWKNLKAFALVLLLLADIFFLAAILKRNRAAKEYDDALVSEAIAVFRESGLIVEKSLLRERVSSFPSYTGVYDRGAKTALRASLEEADFSVYETLGGLSCRGATDTLTVNHDFTFSYSVDGGSRGTPSVLYADAKANGNLIGDSAERKALKEAAEDFFDRIGLMPPKRAQYAITLEDAYRDGNMILIRVCQTVRGRKTQNFSYLLYSADVVWAADGTFAPSAASEKTSAACVGLLDLLFSEKRYFDQQAKEGKPDYHLLASVEYEYKLYFDAAGGFYFLPVCRLTYLNGEQHLYQCITGERLPEDI